MKISVIIPCYNREETIQRSVNSVLNQTILKRNDVEIEVIIVDDCSTDNSLETIKKIDDSRVHLVQLEKNRGANFARNKGVCRALGDFIAFQDSDDEWHLDKLEVQINYLIEKNVDIVFSSLTSIDGQKVTIVPSGLVEGEVGINNFLDFNKMSTQVILGKRKCFEQEKFDESLTRFQDWELAIRLVHKYKVYFINKPLATQYIQKNSITKNPNKAYDSLIQIEEKHRKLYSDYKSHYAKLYESIAFFAVLTNQNANKYFRKSLETSFDLKVFCKYILNIIKIYPLMVRLKN